LLDKLEKKFIKSNDIDIKNLIDAIRNHVDEHNVSNNSFYNVLSASSSSPDSMSKSFKYTDLFKNTYMSCKAKLRLIKKQFNDLRADESFIGITKNTVRNIINLVNILKNGLLSRNAAKLEKILYKIRTQLIAKYKKKYNFKLMSEYTDYEGNTSKLNTLRSLSYLIQSNMTSKSTNVSFFFTLKSYDERFPSPGNSIYKLLDYNATGKNCYIEIYDIISESIHKITLTHDEFGVSNNNNYSSSSKSKSIKINVY